MDSQGGCDQELMYVVVNSSWGMSEGVFSVSGFPNPRVLEQVQHVYVIAEENSWELLRS